MKRYDQIPHTADLAARIYGKSLNELFQNAAYAMFDMMADLSGLGSRETIKIEVEAQDIESLLIKWLNELLYTSYSKKIIFSNFLVKNLSDKKIIAEAKGESLGKNSKRIHSEIKAATYHDVKIEKTGSRHKVTVVFDV